MLRQTDRLSVTKMPYFPALDGVRAIAVLIVFIGHARLLPRFPAGFGVTVFFFLSGYLITTLMRIEVAGTGKISLPHFYLRRVLRINPPLWISLIAIGILCYTGLVSANLDVLTVLGEAFFFVNYLPDQGQASGLPSPLWSLAVEEHFYIVFPILIVFLSRKFTARHIAALLLAACGAILLLRLFNVYALNIVEENYYWSHTRADSILFGCILGFWSNPLIEKDLPWKANLMHAAIAFAAILLTFAPASAAFRETFRYTVQGLALFVLFSYILQDHKWLNATLTHPALRSVGLYSYTIYLIHYALLLAAEHATQSTLGRATIAAVGSYAFAAAMFALVERPMARVRHRLNAAQRSANATQL